MSKNIQVRMIGAEGNIALIGLRGFLDSVVACQLQEQGEELIQQGRWKYVIDLEHLEYVSSAGIETFHNLAQKLQKQEGMMIFVNVPEKIHKVFEIIGITTLIPVRKTVSEAEQELETV